MEDFKERRQSKFAFQCSGAVSHQEGVQFVRSFKVLPSIHRGESFSIVLYTTVLNRDIFTNMNIDNFRSYDFTVLELCMFSKQFA